MCFVLWPFLGLWTPWKEFPRVDKSNERRLDQPSDLLNTAGPSALEQFSDRREKSIEKSPLAGLCPVINRFGHASCVIRYAPCVISKQNEGTATKGKNENSCPS